MDSTPGPRHRGAMKILSNTPDRLVLGRTNLIGGLAALSVTPVTGFLGVMMIIDEPPALGWFMIVLTIAMVVLGILAMMTKTRLILDREQDIVRLSQILPWKRRHQEMRLSDMASIEFSDDPSPESDLIRLDLVPRDDTTAEPLRIGEFFTTGRADVVASPIRKWLSAADA